MKLSKETQLVLNNFANINTNLVIKPGKKITTISSSKDIMSEYEGEDDFEKQVSVFNLNELLGVISSFDKPELDLEDKFMTIKQDKQKVKYVYADEALLTTPQKPIIMPKAEIKFVLSATQLARLQKMSGILAVEDLAFVGNGKKIVAKVFDSKNPTGNSFDVDLESDTTETFNVLFKVEKLKLIGSMDFDVEISSQRISKFSSKSINLVTYVSIEQSSTFK